MKLVQQLSEQVVRSRMEWLQQQDCHQVDPCRTSAAAELTEQEAARRADGSVVGMEPAKSRDARDNLWMELFMFAIAQYRRVGENAREHDWNEVISFILREG